MCTERTSPELAGLVDTVVTLAVFTLCSSCMLALTGVLQDAIETSRVYIISFVPVFASVLTACGQVGGAALYSGFFFGAAMVMADILCRVGLPLTRVLLALNATAAVGSTLDLSQLTASVCRWTKWLLTFCATVFGALIGLQGIFAQSADTLALKTGKFLLSSGVPVVGRAISDAMGSVLAGLKMLKGTVGFAVIAVIAASFLPLLIQCCAYHLVFSAGNIVASATGGTKSAKLLSGLSDCVSLYISMVVFFSLIVISSTLVMILLGNGG
ncbi:MAG: stage III sporulation protein AE [Ruthenibacterium lactatiformans]